MFTPSRLTLARKRRGHTKKGLAELIDVSTRSVTAFESGEIEPKPVTLARLSKVLDFPPSFFEAEDLPELSSDAVSFRALSKMEAAQRHSAESALLKVKPGLDPLLEPLRSRCTTGSPVVSSCRLPVFPNSAQVSTQRRRPRWCVQSGAWVRSRSRISFIFLRLGGCAYIR